LTVEPGSAVPSVLDVAPSLPEVAAALPSAAAVAVDPARVPARAQRGAAPRVTVPPVLTGDVVATVGFAIERFLDTSVLWLSGLPSNPITDFLTGALWLVRRTLFPVGAGVGLGGSAACVATKDCSGQDLRGADLQRADLSGVNFTKADLRDVNVQWANLTGANLSNANLDSSNQFARYTNLNDANLTDANFTNATLSGASLGRSSLTGAILIGANLSYIDLSRQNLVGKDLTGTNLTATDLYQTDLTSANLTDADLTNANIIAANLTGVTWSNTKCPHGGASSSGCSAYPLAPAAGFDNAKLAWYEYRSPRATYLSSTALQGTIGAPMQSWAGDRMGPNNDGVQGVIYNTSSGTILVRNEFRGWGYTMHHSDAILVPGTSMSYQLSSVGGNPDPSNLQIFNVDYAGRAVGNPAVVWLYDNYLDRPETRFTPPGAPGPVNVRTGWEEGDSHSDIWGDTNIWLKREDDDWRVPASPAFTALYSDPNTFKTRDWAIFTIKVNSLATS
jgi:uncharacterized protein YjbI with pentapeptide repeats